MILPARGATAPARRTILGLTYKTLAVKGCISRLLSTYVVLNR